MADPPLLSGLRSERRLPDTTQSRLQCLVTIVLWVALMPLAYFLNRNTDWAGALPTMLYFGLQYLFATTVIIRLPVGYHLGLGNFILFTVAILLGYQPALWLGIAMPVLTSLLRLPFIPFMGFPRSQRRKICFESIINGLISSISLVLSGWLINRPDEILPASGDHLGLTLLFAGMLLYSGIHAALLTLWVWQSQRQFSLKNYWQQYLSLIVSNTYVPIFFAPLLARIYLTFPDYRLIDSIAFAAAVLLAFGINRARFQLMYRAADLRVLNNIGQTLTGKLELNTLLDAIYGEIGQLVDTSNFYLALYSTETNIVSFPLIFDDGKRSHNPPRQFANCMAEYVIRTGSPLLLDHNASETAQKKLKIELLPNVISNPVRSYLGVPILVDGSVMGVIALRDRQADYAYSQADVRLVQTIAAQVGGALRNAQLFERSQAQAARLASLNRVSTLLWESASLEETLEAICKVVVEVLGTQKAAIFLLNQTDKLVELVASIGLSDAFIANSQQLSLSDTSTRTQALNTGEVVTFEDLSILPEVEGFAKIAKVEKVKAVLDVPLRIGNQVIGTVAAYYDEVHPIDQQEIKFLETVGGQVAIAVENARLFKEMGDRNRDLETLFTANAVIGSSLSLSNVLQAVTTSLLRALDMDSCTVFFGLEDGETLRAEYQTLMVDEEVVEQSELFTPFDLYLSQLPNIMGALTRLRPLTLRIDHPPLTQPESALMQRLDLASGVAIPLNLRDGNPGLIMIGNNKEQQELEPSKLRLAEALVNHAAIATQNARLFERTDVALAQRLDEIAALELVSQRMTRELDLHDVLEQLVEVASKATNSDIGEVALVDEQNQTLRSFARRGPDDWAPTEEWPVAEGITGRALRRGQAEVVDNVQKDSDYLDTSDNTCSELVAPIILDGQRLGIINLESVKGNAFTFDHLRFVSNLAEHAAIAIQNARLFEAAERRAEEFTVLHNVAIDLLTTTDIYQSLQVIARTALKRTQATKVHIYLYDSEDDELTLGTSLYDDGQVDIEYVKPHPNGFTITIARTGQRIVSIEPANEPIFSDMVKTWGEDFHAAGIPLKHGTEVVGVFNIFYNLQHPLNDHKLRFLNLLTTQAALAIANARLAEQTREVKDRLQAIINTIHDGIMMFNVEGRLLMANPRAEYLLNLRVKDFIGQHFLGILAKLTATLGKQGMAYSLEETLTLVKAFQDNPNEITRRRFTLEQPEFQAIEEISIAVAGDENEMLGRLLILRDITQEYEMQAYREQMSHMIVHDLRSPIGGTITGLHLAIDELTENADNPDISMLQAALNASMISANVLLRLVETMLDVNKLETGDLHIVHKPVDLKAMINQVFTTLEATATNANITVDIITPDDLEPIAADEDKIERIIQNLLDNALRYAPKDGRVEVQVKPNQTEYTISIKDNGPGIPAEFRERIFERFYQVDVTRRQRGSKGSGLGLTFCKLAVEAHGGRIWVDDGIDGGSAFHFTLPVVPLPDEDENDEQT